MAGTYVLGETKVRPGAYFNIQKKGTGQQSGTVSGVTAVLFRSDFGPLNTAVELNPDDGFANTFGNGGTTDAIQEAINGGAQTIIACRVGNGGTSATATLNTAEGQAAVKITAAYPGKKAFTVTVYWIYRPLLPVFPPDSAPVELRPLLLRLPPLRRNASQWTVRKPVLQV